MAVAVGQYQEKAKKLSLDTEVGTTTVQFKLYGSNILWF